MYPRFSFLATGLVSFAVAGMDVGSGCNDETISAHEQSQRLERKRGAAFGCELLHSPSCIDLTDEDEPAAKRRAATTLRDWLSQAQQVKTGAAVAKRRGTGATAVAADVVPGSSAPSGLKELLGPALLPSGDTSGPHAVYVPLTADGTSWLWVVKRLLPSRADRFQALWQSHPPEFGKARIFAREVSFHRYQQAFGVDYAFSGQVAEAKPLTNASAPQVFFVKEALRSWLDEAGQSLRQLRYEACLVNWYDGGGHSIGAHSDDERELVKGAPIFALSWGATRTFRVTPRTPSAGRRAELELRDGDLVVMGGRCQQTHKHEVPKSAKCKGQRISLTFRCFNSQQR
eukprot:gnl/TRDRNA2_/TRDRNA2_153816_c0_seq6.p1 gnl/TRDRNA2_/TRDRNA2_153816_c0~~gnl/TRDRNA2_/TRDRNA2_153816_c0_seq6.p1  ORF type:complete len:344 (+),score=48.89 gnl/TRDRNA2_/TRDRNA2_153816_c0_seq6:20-1051(+)